MRSFMSDPPLDVYVTGQTHSTQYSRQHRVCQGALTSLEVAPRLRYDRRHSRHSKRLSRLNPLSTSIPPAAIAPTPAVLT